MSYICPMKTTNGLSEETLVSKMWNYDNPLAQKTIGGIDYRIAEGFIVDKKKTYLLYKDGIIFGEPFNSVEEIKESLIITN